MHPIIDVYCNKDLSELSKLKRSFKSDPLIEAIFNFFDVRYDQTIKSFQDAISKAEAVKIKTSDPDLCMLFFVLWAEASAKVDRLSEAAVLIKRAKELVSSKTHPMLRASVIGIEAYMFRRGCSEKKLKEILELLPKSCPNRKFWVTDLAVLLAIQGRMKEIEEDVKFSSYNNDMFSIVNFIDCVERGSIDEATQFLHQIDYDRYEKWFKVLPPRDDEPWKKYLIHSKMVYDFILNWKSSISAKPDLPASAMVLLSLLKKEPQQALFYAKIPPKEALLSSEGFSSYNLVRAELAAKNVDNAKHILDQYRASENGNYMNDFFLARVELQRGNKHRAVEHFAKFLKNIERYQAQGRLDFELQLASEISPSDLLDIGRSAERILSSRKWNIEKETSELIPSEKNHGLDRCIGVSNAFDKIRNAIKQFAPLDTPILITGETGTGKEVVAQAIHDIGPRKSQPFIAINCGAIAESLLESELFGHARGAFTGAEKARQGLFMEAGKGTLFLDEIGDAPPRIQIALLRVLETGEVRPIGSNRIHHISCRVIAATNANMEERVRKGLFRSDLLFRLQRLEIQIPPLRERPEDIIALADHFLSLGRRWDVQAFMTPQLKTLLYQYKWPGNVRELRNEIERMRLMNSDKLLYDVEDLEIKFRNFSVPHLNTRSSPQNQKTEDSDLILKKEPLSQSVTFLESGKGEKNIHEFLKQGRFSLRRLECLRNLFQEHPTLTRSEIIQILQIAPSTATIDLKTLCQEGFIKKVEPRPAPRTHYFILNK